MEKLYRAWYNNKMWYGNEKGGIEELYGNFVKNINTSLSDENIVWLQFVGIRDKNGKRVYEGDIVKYKYKHIESHREEIGEIIWKRFGFFNADPKLHACMSIIVEAANTYEVIGNIYENPDLLTNN